MTDIFKTPEKLSRRDRLFLIGIETLRGQGWTVERIQGVGKSSVRKITKDGQSKVVSIKTSQDTYIAFAREGDDTAWSTLSEVDAVLAVSVDDGDDPRFALVHMIDAEDMVDRFDRAYAARKAAGRQIQLGRGLWLALYIEENRNVPAHVGAGAGLANPPIAKVPLNPREAAEIVQHQMPHEEVLQSDEVLTISEAKRRLARSLGVDPAHIKITVEA